MRGQKEGEKYKGGQGGKMERDREGWRGKKRSRGGGEEGKDKEDR